MLVIILGFLVTLAIVTVTYAQTRSFVTRRLRYVDAVQNSLAPFAAGIAAAVLAMPLVAIIPLLGVGTALSFGFAVGMGVAAGAREVRGTLPRY
jgi:hypothetical protein